MFVMVTCRFPPSKAFDVGKIYAVRPAMPSFIKLRHVLVRSEGEIKIYALYEVEKGREWEGFKTIGNRFIANFSIEGYRFETECLLTIEEAAPLLGLSPS